MKDFLGQDLAEGDNVIYVLQGYREFRVGTIKRFTPCFVIIEQQGTTSRPVSNTIKQKPGQVVKVTKEQLLCREAQKRAQAAKP